jgi:hypothetical protein
MDKKILRSIKVSGERYLKISEAAQFLGVTPLTLRNWDKKGRLGAYRHPANNYRLYPFDQLREFKARGLKPKIQEVRGFKKAVFWRANDFTLARKTLDVLVTPEATTPPENLKIDRFINRERERAQKRGIKTRIIRNLEDPGQLKRAKEHFKEGTRHYPLRGLQFTIRDNQVVRLEIPTTDPDERLNLIIDDKNIARTLRLFFNSLWQDAKTIKEYQERR